MSFGTRARVPNSRVTYAELAEKRPDLVDDRRRLEAGLGLGHERLRFAELALGILDVVGHVGVRRVGLESWQQLLEFFHRFQRRVVVLLNVETVDEVLEFIDSIVRTRLNQIYKNIKRGWRYI